MPWSKTKPRAVKTPAQAAPDVIDLAQCMYIEEAMQITGLAHNTVALYARQGKIKGRQIGITWLLDRESVKLFNTSLRARGKEA